MPRAWRGEPGRRRRGRESKTRRHRMSFRLPSSATTRPLARGPPTSWRSSTRPKGPSSSSPEATASASAEAEREPEEQEKEVRRRRQVQRKLLLRLLSLPRTPPICIAWAPSRLQLLWRALRSKQPRMRPAGRQGRQRGAGWSRRGSGRRSRRRTRESGRRQRGAGRCRHPRQSLPSSSSNSSSSRTRSPLSALELHSQIPLVSTALPRARTPPTAPPRRRHRHEERSSSSSSSSSSRGGSGRGGSCSRSLTKTRSSSALSRLLPRLLFS